MMRMMMLTKIVKCGNTTPRFGVEHNKLIH